MPNDYAAMRARAEFCTTDTGAIVRTLARDVLALLADVERKDKALLRYGRHEDACISYQATYPDPRSCSCGFVAALTPMPEKEAT